MVSLHLLLVAAAAAAAAENPVFSQLTEHGVRVADETFVKIQPPTMADGLPAAGQQALIAQVAGPRRRVADLLRKSVVAPFVLEIGQVSAAEGRPPLRTVDVWFVAYGSLDQFTSEDSLEELSETADSGSKSRLPATRGLLTEDQIHARGIGLSQSEDRSQRYSYSTFPLFDRVQLSTTWRSVVTETAESVLIAAAIDPRFTGDSDYPNEWRSVSRDSQGQFTLGPESPYESAGFYGKVTRLAEPPGALFIEFHQVFEEPPEWFGGANLLRSKLPMLVQDAVRKLRREVRE